LDTFDKLGYYFVVIRALDEGYFKYTPGSPKAATVVDNSATSSATAVGQQSPETLALQGRRTGWGMGRSTGKAAIKGLDKVEIIEDNPGKEGLEGVGVGGVNVYLVVFKDGIISVSIPVPVERTS
jgi:magnesium transporter